MSGAEAAFVAMAKTPTRPARILCLDGGGVKGVATLQILKEIMNVVKQQWTEGQDTPRSQGEIKPCDYFDLICGTSTGGLIALMLGRLEFVRVPCRG
jgi:patatin-like phospholipase/acyl hydrolase